MSYWTKAPSKKASRGNKKASSFSKTTHQPQKPSMTEAEIRHFLSSFKTASCEAEAFHDHRFCENYHEFKKDGRRDPYKECYAVDEESATLMERMYHPSVFRTSMCKRQACMFQSICAHAHTDADIRSREKASDDYMKLFQEPNRALPVLWLSFLKRKNETTSGSATKHGNKEESKHGNKDEFLLKVILYS